jgi:uncharacterized protein YjbI with pentapeptide repeats
MRRHERASLQTAATPDARPRYTQAQMEQFIAAHERYHRRQPRAKRAVMPFLLAHDIDFSRRVLVEADFTGADMQRANLFMANFERASLFCADLRGADARGVNLFRADLRGCSLRDANLTGARLDDADMREAMLARVDPVRGFHVVGKPAEAETRAVDFTNCSMKRVKLGQAKLKGANFSGAMLQGADLKGAVLEGAKFDGAVLIGADLAQARIDPDALQSCVLAPTSEALKRVAELTERLVVATRWIATNGAEGRPAALDSEDLRPMGAAFENARLTALSAKRVCAIGMSFAGAQLQGANFAEADLREADFTGADLRGACFRGANLSHARFDNANLKPLQLTGGVRHVDLSNAAVSEDAFLNAVLK